MSRKKTVCPFCGRLIIRDDVALAILHEAPTCAGFAEVLRASGAKPTLAHVPGGDAGAHLDALAKERRGRQS